MKKFGTVALVLLAFGCATPSDAQKKDAPLAYRTVQAGNVMLVRSSQPRAIIAQSEKELEIYWASVIGATPPPKIDFRKEQAVLLCAGAVPTGGYNIKVQSVHRDGKRLAVTAPIIAPAPDMMVTQAVSYPYIVIAVPTRKIRQVRWLDASGNDVELSVVGDVQYQ